MFEKELCKTEEGRIAWIKAKNFANEYPYKFENNTGSTGKYLDCTRRDYRNWQLGTLKGEEGPYRYNLDSAKKKFAIKQFEGIRKYFEENKEDGKLAAQARSKISETKEGQELIKRVSKSRRNYRLIY